MGRARGIPVRVDTERGKGSHVTLYYGDRPSSETPARTSKPASCRP